MILFMIFLMICLGENINVYEFLCLFFVFKMMFYDGFMFFYDFSLSLHRDLFYVFLVMCCVFLLFLMMV